MQFDPTDSRYLWASHSGVGSLTASTPVMILRQNVLISGACGKIQAIPMIAIGSLLLSFWFDMRRAFLSTMIKNRLH
jgi:hypothetical protein